MLLSKIIGVISPQKLKSYKKKQIIKYITANSKLIKNNSIYVADFKKNIKKTFVDEAINNGAVAILTNKKIKDLNVTQLIVKNLPQTVDLILHILKPFAPKNIIGVTGTNGKTSVVWLLSNILKTSGLDVRSIGTLGYYKNLKKISEAFLTTPEKEELHQLSYLSSPKKIELIFEVSSHGISKKRIKNFPINIAAITNITQDHLDYHKTFENYRKVKFRLFLNYLSKNGVAIINDNIKRIDYLKKILKKRNIKIITYGKNSSDIHCFTYKNLTKIKIYSKLYNIRYLATIDFELENLACSVCCSIALGLNTRQIIKSISTVSKPEGRFQLVNSLNNGAKIFVDYAHNPGALKNILIGKYYDCKKPNLVFGCGGDRDKSKRKKMGKIANKYANKIYITDDNPRNEDPAFIRRTINTYCSNAFNIGNRRLAIKTAIENLNSKEILIIAGKGHEKKQITKNTISNFDDVKIANYYIKKQNLKR